MERKRESFRVKEILNEGYMERERKRVKKRGKCSLDKEKERWRVG